MIGCCGDLCDECPRLITTLDDNPGKLDAVLSLWIRTGMRDKNARVNDIICTGCSNVSWCRYQRIRDCVRERALTNCGGCSDYPCSQIKQVFRQTDIYRDKCRADCSPDDFLKFDRIFFKKKEILDRIHHNRFGKRS